jgi:hypothetical protein
MCSTAYGVAPWRSGAQIGRPGQLLLSWWCCSWLAANDLSGYANQASAIK